MPHVRHLAAGVGRKNLISHVMRQGRTRDVARRVRISRLLGRPPGPGRATEAPGRTVPVARPTGGDANG